MVTTTATRVAEIQAVATRRDPGGTISAGNFALVYNTVGTHHEKQTITVSATSGTMVAGGFKLGFADGPHSATASLVTSCIAFNAAASDIETALETLTNVTDAVVSRSGDATQGYVFTVAFVTTVPSDKVLGNLVVSEGPAQSNPCTAWVGGSGHAVTVATTDDAGFDLTYQATAAEVKAELEKFPNVGTVNVVRSLADEEGGFVWTVSFADESGDLNEMTCVTDNFHTNSVISDAPCGVSTVSDGNQLGGTFILSLGAEETSALAHSATASQVQTALQAFNSIAAVAVTRGAADTQLGYSWTISFTSNVGDVPLMESINSLTGTGANIAIEERHKGNYLGGSFKLGYGGYKTGSIQYNASAAQLKAAIENMPSIGATTVARSSVDTQGGSTWTVTFTDPVKTPGDIALLSMDSSAITGVGKVLLAREVTKGAEASGTSLAVSFGAPSSGGGAAITKYKVEHSPSADFSGGNVQYSEIEDADKLFTSQTITVDAALAREVKLVTVSEETTVQSIHINATSTILEGSYKLMYDGKVSPCIDFNASKEVIQAQILSIVGANVSSVYIHSTSQSVDIEVNITDRFRNPLPYAIQVALIGANATGTCDAFRCTNYAPCVAAPGNPGGAIVWVDHTNLAGTFALTVDTSACTNCLVKSSQNTASIDVTNVDPDTSGNIEYELNALSNVVGGVRITRQTQPTREGLVFSITFVGGYVIGSGMTVAVQANALTGDRYANGHSSAEARPSIGVSTHATGTMMGGAFRLSYGGATTARLAWNAGAISVRDELEKLSTIDTVSVSRRTSFELVSTGTVGVQHGSSAVTTSVDLRPYLAKGNVIEIGGESFRIRSGSAFTATGFALAPVSDTTLTATFAGSTAASVAIYKSTDGYSYDVVMQKVSVQSPSENLLFTSPLNSLSPIGQARLSITGGRQYTKSGSLRKAYGCDKCHYITGLTVGSTIYVRVFAYNNRGYNLIAGSTAVSSVPKTVPAAPSNVQLSVVSGTSLEVKFSPPSFTSGDSIVRYRVEWDKTQTWNSASFGFAHFTDVHLSSPYSHVITGLTSGETYYVRVRAENSVPFQNTYSAYNYVYATSNPASAVPADRVPDSPVSVDVSVLSGTSIRLLIAPPSRNGGQAVTSYRIDYDTASNFASCGTSCQSTVTASTLQTVTTGSKLVYDITGLTAGTVYYARVSAISSVGTGAARNAGTLPALSPSPVTPSEAPSAPLSPTVSVLSSQSAPIREIQVGWSTPTSQGGSALSAFKVEWFSEGPVKEKQKIQTSNTGGGQFLLKFGGHPTGYMAYDVSAVKMRWEIMNLGNGSVVGDVSVIRTPGTSDSNGNPTGYSWDVTFEDTISNPGDQIEFVPNKDFLTGTSPEIFVTEVTKGRRAIGSPEVQTLTLSGSAATGGFFKVSFAGAGPSSYLPAAATANQVRDALQALSTVNTVTVTREGDASSTSCSSECAYGYRWKVQFTSNWAEATNFGNLPAMTVQTTDLTGSGVALVVHDGSNAVNSEAVKLCSVCAPGEQPANYNYAIVAANLRSYQITNLVAGTSYRVRVSAKNGRGYGAVASSTPTSITPPMQVPGKPTGVSVAVFPGDSTKLKVTYSAPTSNGGSDVLKYRVEYDDDASFGSAGAPFEFRCPNHPIRKVVEIRSAASNGYISQGSFKLTLTRGGTSSTTQKINATAVDMKSEESVSRNDVYVGAGTTFPSDVTGSMQAQLQDLSNMATGVSVKRTGPNNDGGYTWTVYVLREREREGEGERPTDNPTH